MLVALAFQVPLLGCAPSQPVGPASNADNGLTAEGARIDAELLRSGMRFREGGVEEILTRTLAKVAPKDAGTISLHVYRNPHLNAFVLPNRSIWVHVGLLAYLEDPAQLALVLAHEVVHLRRNHAREALQDRTRKKLASQIVGLVFAPVGLADPVSQGLYSIMVAGYGRDREVEADRDAFEMVRRARFPLASLPTLFDKIEAIDDNSTPALYNDHPSNAARKAALVALLSGGKTRSNSQDTHALRPQAVRSAANGPCRATS